MLSELFETVINDWKKAIKSRYSPLKYGTLTTIDPDGRPRSRTVVIRKIENDLGILFFTDSRSQKVQHITKNSKACLLMYHHKQLKQMRWDGDLFPIIDQVEVQHLFQRVSDKSIKDYTTVNAPGDTILNPDHVRYTDRDQAYFMPLRFFPKSMEYLQLKRPNHLRALFELKKDWTGKWLTP